MLLAEIQFDGIDGFLGTNASLMLDVVFVAMFLVVPVLLYSIKLAKRGNYQLHKQIQIATATVLLAAVIAFEIDMRFFTDWELRADPNGEGLTAAWIALGIHLCFAIPTPILWIVIISKALKHFPNPPIPNEHSAAHKKRARIGAYGMILTSITGWIFYYVAFIM